MNHVTSKKINGSAQGRFVRSSKKTSKKANAVVRTLSDSPASEAFPPPQASVLTSRFVRQRRNTALHKFERLTQITRKPPFLRESQRVAGALLPILEWCFNANTMALGAPRD
ncbi:hypothetical protein WJ542_20995 [Paraburkholderia sp. B3]|uniref:hypothetical protein n=1 Tax=Paraburkholderia sp. B3 TaxID=3134791 RepID=UPI0039820C1F